MSSHALHDDPGHYFPTFPSSCLHIAPVCLILWARCLPSLYAGRAKTRAILVTVYLMIEMDKWRLGFLAQMSSDIDV